LESTDGDQRERGIRAPAARGTLGDGQLKTPTLEWLEEALQPQGEEALPAYSAVEILTQKDFSTFSADELDEVSRLVVAIAKRVATRLSRRARATPHGHQMDLRRTIRHSLRRGGEIVDLFYRRRKIRKTRVVLWQMSAARWTCTAGF